MRIVVAIAVIAAFVGPRPARADGGVAELLAQTDAIAAEVAKVRGLKAKRPIARDVIERDAIRKRLAALVARQYTAAEIAVEQRVLRRLGMLAADDDYLDLYLGLAAEQIVGFYDPWERTLFLAGDGEPDALVMAHEIVHALQDQHFDLRRFMAVGKQNGDAEIARQALVEGDGMAVMIEMMFAQLDRPPPWGDPAATGEIAQIFDASAAAPGGADALAKAPLFMQVGMMFPYAAGLKFVMHVRALHPWARVDAAYRKPPLSTEHILHPAKYDAYERPVAVREPALPALKGYRRIYTNVTGELGFSVLLRQHGVERAVAEEAAAGWGGDRIAVYAPKRGDDGSPGAAVAVSASAWDTEIDAIEAYEALVSALPSLSGGEEIAPGLYRDADGKRYQATRDGERVTLVIGLPAQPNK